MLAGAAREYLERFGVLAGSRAVLLTTNDAGYDAAAVLAAAGLEVAAVVDPRPGDRAVPDGAEHLPGAVVCAAEGERRVTAAVVGDRSIACDLLLVSGGWSPAVHLLSQAQGTVRWDAGAGGFVPDAVPDGWHVAGAVTGTYDHDACVAQGAAAGAARRPASGRRTAPRARRRPSPRRCSGRSRRPRAAARTTASSTSSATRRSPTSAAPPPPACARPSTSSASRRSGPRTTRAARPACSRSASWRSCSSGRSTRSARRRSGRRSRRSASRCSPVATAATSPIPSARPRSTPGTSRTAPCSRTSASGSGRGSTRARARTWTPPSCASAPRRATRVAMMDASTLGKIDVQGPDAVDVPQPALHRRLLDAQARPLPLRPALHRRRDGVRRRRDDAARPRTASSSPRRPATRPRCSTGSRSGCRPSGPSCASTAPR